MSTISYTFIKSVAAATWNINHNLNSVPIIDVMETAAGVTKRVMPASVIHVDLNNTTVTFSSAVAGQARLIGAFQLDPFSSPSAVDKGAANVTVDGNTVTVTAATTDAGLGNPTALITLTRIGNTSAESKLTYAVTSPSPANSDGFGITPASGTVTFAPTDTTAVISLTLAEGGLFSRPLAAAVYITKVENVTFNDTAVTVNWTSS